MGYRHLGQCGLRVSVLSLGTMTFGGRGRISKVGAIDVEGARPQLVLAADERAKLDAVSAPPLLYPYWRQAKTAADWLSPADLSLLRPYVS